MRGNFKTLKERLDAGKATGALLFDCGGVALRAGVGPKGRGLYAVRDAPRGADLCRLPGTLVEGSEPPDVGREVFLVRKPREDAPGRWLVLDPPTRAAPGNLANTSDGRADGGNNAKLVFKPGATHVTLRALRAIKEGEEVLCAYGGGYTRALRRAAEARPKPPHAFTSVACGACGARMQQFKLSAHARSYACAARRNPSGAATRASGAAGGSADSSGANRSSAM